ncbi:hypothetical protein Droror1_Dr00021079 [Drosera rotundifolia]
MGTVRDPFCGSVLRVVFRVGGVVAFEPCYVLGRKAWDFEVSKKVFGNDVAGILYHTVDRNLGWHELKKLELRVFEVVEQVARADCV